MSLKHVVDGLLKEKNRPMSWLAEEMNKTFDGLKLSLVRGSIKYNDLIEMAKVLEVSPIVFFRTSPGVYKEGNDDPLIISEPNEAYNNEIKTNLKNCREMLSVLKDQLKDKELIISLLKKSSG
ncbi:MAG TPA: hypothetical protein VKB19_03080 [Pedobacter sp.]|nr:hypothetical protein [Pedobacter sp.]